MSSNVRQLYSIVKFKKNLIFLTCRFRAILGYCGPLNNLRQRTSLFSFIACCIMFFVLFSLKPWCCVRVYSMTLYFILSSFFCLIQNISSLYLIPVSNLDQSQFFMLNLYSRPFQILILSISKNQSWSCQEHNTRNISLLFHKHIL